MVRPRPTLRPKAEPVRHEARRTLAPQEPPPGIYACKFDWDLAAAIATRVVNGESLRSVCRADPAMPTEKTVWNWRRARPEFDELMTWANATARARSLAEQGRADAAKREAKAAARRARGFRPYPRLHDGYAPDVAEAILDRLVMGESLTNICRDPAMPCVGTVYNWMRRYPDLVRGYRTAKWLCRERLVDEAAEELRAVTKLRAGRRRLKAYDLQIARLSPKRYG